MVQAHSSLYTPQQRILLYHSGLDLHPDHRIYPVIFFSTVGCGKEGFSHNSVTDIKDVKKKTEAAVSSTVTDRLQHFCAAAQGAGEVQSVTKAQRRSRGMSLLFL